MVGNDSVIARVFADYSAATLSDYTGRIEKCLGLLDDAALWSREDEVENSIGNLCVHLAGNVRQWLIATVGGVPDTRDRDSEFAARSGGSGAQLAAALRRTVEEANIVIDSLSEQRLAERVHVQGYDVTVLEAVYHVIEHFAHHSGQIIFETKRRTRQDLGFFAHLSKQPT